MDWTIIISSLVTFLAGGGIAGVVFWRAARRKANAEASHAEADSDSVVVDSMTKLVENLQEQEDKYLALLGEKDKRIEELYTERRAIRDETLASQYMMCVNMGCVLRKPVQGQGRGWYAANREDPSLGANYLPVNRLLQLYGKNKDEEDMRKYMSGRDGEEGAQ